MPDKEEIESVREEIRNIRAAVAASTELDRTAYEAYHDEMGWVDANGFGVPDWASLLKKSEECAKSKSIVSAWRAAAGAAATGMFDAVTDPAANPAAPCPYCLRPAEDCACSDQDVSTDIGAKG